MQPFGSTIQKPLSRGPGSVACGLWCQEPGSESGSGPREDPKPGAKSSPTTERPIKQRTLVPSVVGSCHLLNYKIWQGINLASPCWPGRQNLAQQQQQQKKQQEQKDQGGSRITIQADPNHLPLCAVLRFPLLLSAEHLSPESEYEYEYELKLDFESRS